MKTAFDSSRRVVRGRIVRELACLPRTTEHCTERMTENVLETTGQINGVSKDDQTERASLKSVGL
ncbi:hypothetical protein E4U61_000496, partial [Claviceps capensis]